MNGHDRRFMASESRGEKKHEDIAWNVA